MKNSERITIAVDVPRELVRRMKLDAIRRDQPMREVLCDALESYIPASLRLTTEPDDADALTQKRSAAS